MKMASPPRASAAVVAAVEAQRARQVLRAARRDAARPLARNRAGFGAEQREAPIPTSLQRRTPREDQILLLLGVAAGEAVI